MLNKKDIVLFYTKARLEDDTFETYMGFLWWILDPLMSASVYYVVFHLILNRGRPNYLPYLFVGIVVWKWFQSSVVSGSSSIANQKNLIKKIFLPKIIFPWVEINFTSFRFMVAFSLILTLYPLLGYPVTANHFLLPLIILCQFVFTLGIATFLSSLTPFFPDFTMMVNHLLRLAFYPSGILFSADRVPEKWRFLMDYNPMARAVEGYRNVVMYGKGPSLTGLLLLMGLGVLFYGIGLSVITRFEGRYAKL